MPGKESFDEVFADNLSCCSDMDVLELKYLDDDDDDLSDNNDFSDNKVFPVGSEWSEVDRTPVLEDFLGHPGVKVMPNNPESVSDCVELFIGDDLFQMMVEETNRYHAQNIHKFKQSKKSLKWRDVNIIELKKMLGLILIMGHVRKDDRYEYWSTDALVETPIFSKVLSRDRFNQIWQSWHFSKNEELNQHSDRLFKIQPILDYTIPKFNNVYGALRELSLYEGMIPWRGRLSFEVHNSLKIIKYGILVRIVCEASTGYICNLEMYHARGNKLLETLDTVLKPYSNKNHHVYMDNYYNSVETSEILLKNKIRTCGTIRINRGVPESLGQTKLKVGQTAYRRKGDTLIQKWMSTKEIRLISNIHSAKMLVSNNIDWRTRQNIIQPEMVIEYNKYMKGVDRADQHLSNYPILKKTKKWTKRAAIYLLNCALFNSFRVYKTLNKNKIGYKKYLLLVAKKWISDETTQSDTAVPGPSTVLQRTTMTNWDQPGRLSMDLRKHQLENIPRTEKTQCPQRQCRVCTANKIKSKTRHMCKFCKVPLHRDNCFYIYHTRTHLNNTLKKNKNNHI